MSLGDPVAFGLPHREPFIFIDAVEKLELGTSAVCLKTFLAEEPFFRGHFPGDPIVPGVILAEALAQAAGIAVGVPGTALRLSALRSMKFFASVRPGQTVRLTARKLAEIGGLYQFEVLAEADTVRVAEGVLILNEV